MRRLVTALCLAAASCGDEPGASEAQRYLTDRAFRRAELVASLTTTDNDYARLRLARYDTADARDWSLRPVWNPPAAPLVPAATPLRPLDLPASTDRASLLSLGEAAFSRYPAMLASTTVEATLRAPGAAARYGFWTSADGHVGGLLRVALADGTVGLAYSCATCHRAPDAEGNAVPGLANGALDLGALGADGNPTIPPAEKGRLRRWGPGRVDVTTDDGREPIAIPDLRAVREQSHLQRSGAVRRRSLSALAIRIETLLITSHHEAVRPPREVALGLALYLDSLADPLPAPRTDHPGAAVFAARCGRCHAPPTWGGGLVAAEEVGTDPSLARSPTRGTGSYRVPSLRGVGARRWLLHDGSVEGLDALLDPARLRDDYPAAPGVGAIPGHVFGLALPAPERSALRAFLSTM
ncbi:MAG: hypothetical protein IPN17_24060 [Deltaproteobacteria bacterium]|nr:hypothetical protein [Deltaproteobacteria bacterium]